MRPLPVFICLLLTLPAFGQAHAQNTAATDSSGAAAARPAPADPYEGIVMYARPEDFATIQQLAMQNRADRIVLLQQSLACLQQATSIDDIYRCRIDESRTLNRIRLTYCETGLATPRRVVGKKSIDRDDAVKVSGCEKAIAALSGRRLTPGKNSVLDTPYNEGQDVDPSGAATTAPNAAAGR